MMPAGWRDARVLVTGARGFIGAHLGRRLMEEGAVVHGVSSHPDPKGKITIVLVNDRRRNLIGFYIYNFGSLKDAANKEEIYKYLLAANDAITE